MIHCENYFFCKLRRSNDVVGDEENHQRKKLTLGLNEDDWKMLSSSLGFDINQLNLFMNIIQINSIVNIKLSISIKNFQLIVYNEWNSQFHSKGSSLS